MIPEYLSPLANHVWQSSLFAVAVGALAWVLKRNRASVRYCLWLAASVKFLIPFSLLVTVGSQFEWRSASTIAPTQWISVADHVGQPFAPPAIAGPPTAVPPTTSSRISAALFSIWVCGFAVIAYSWLREWRRLRAAVRAASPLDLKIPIRAVSSPLPACMEPGVVGVFRPVLLLPRGITDRLTVEQLHAILVHELCHVRRRDNLTAAIHMIVEAVFWFHPLVWWIERRMLDERERACDEEVLLVVGQPQIYAEGILNVCKFYKESPLVCMSGVTGADLTRRLEAIMANHISLKMNRSRKLLLVSSAVLAVAVPVLIGLVSAPASYAQTSAARPQFEVASIKPSFSERIMNVRPLSGRLTADASLQILMQYAYGVEPFQVVGGPGWVESERYQIDAKADATASRDQMFLMLQSLIEDRFQLKTHRDTKELPVFALVVDKGGLKLPLPTEGMCVDSAADAATEWVGGGRIAAPGEIQPAKGRCGAAVLALGLGGAQMNGGKIAMAELARALSMLLGRSVIDRTGFTGLFDLQLDFVPDDTTPSMPPPPPNSGISGVSIAQALQQQLGLRLESTKGPIQVIVVDQAGRPSPN